MTSYESTIKTIPASQDLIFNTLADLANLDLSDTTKEINDNYLKDLRIEGDTIFLKVDMMGELGLQLVEVDPNKTLKFKGLETPIEMLFWIQLKEVSSIDTRLKLTLKADIPMMIKPMASKPIKEFLEKLSTAIVNKSYV